MKQKIQIVLRYIYFSLDSLFFIIDIFRYVLNTYYNLHKTLIQSTKYIFLMMSLQISITF